MSTNPDDVPEIEGGENESKYAGLTPSQKKKLKEKEKKARLAAAAAGGAAPPTSVESDATPETEGTEQKAESTSAATSAPATAPAAKPGAKSGPAGKAPAGKPGAAAATPAGPAAKPAAKPALKGNAAIIAKLQEKKAAEEKKKKAAEEEARLLREAAEAERLREEEEERAKEAAKVARNERLAKMREEGLILTKAEKERRERDERHLAELAARGMLSRATVQRLQKEAAAALGEEVGDESKDDDDKAKSKARPKLTKAQLEAEKMRQRQLREQQARVQARESATATVTEENPAAATAVSEMSSLFQTTSESLNSKKSDLKSKVEALMALDAKAVAPEVAQLVDVAIPESVEAEEALDDWDVDEPEDSEEVTELKSEVASLFSEVSKLTKDSEQFKTQSEAAKKTFEELVLAKLAEMAKAEAEEKKRLEAEEAARLKAQREAEEKASTHVAGSNLRSPIGVVLGHVDSGKTSLLDKIRNSSVQRGEAGGITQQIGATFVPIASVKEMSFKLENPVDYRIPGLLMIDTPGHESFSNLRSRGSDLCDFAILIVDITKSLQQQTLESIRLLKERGTPYVIAVTKIDTLYGWNKDEANAWGSIQKAIENAPFDTRAAIERNVEIMINAFAMEEINIKPFWDNDDPDTWVSYVPVSSKTGEGIPDLLNLVCDIAQTRIARQLIHTSDLKCTVLEVKVLEGHGTTLDVILVNGELNEGDTIVLSGMSGPIVTKIRALLLPPPLKELRLKSEYVTQKTVRAAMGVKISAPNLQDVLAGSSLLVYRPGKDDLEDLKDEVQADLQEVFAQLDTSANGVMVHASSLGSLEALLSFLRESDIPVSSFDIGTVHKASIVKVSTQLEKRRPEYAVLLAFDVKIDPDATALANAMGVTVFSAEIIYHLKDRCLKHFQEVRDNQKRSAQAVFPVVVKCTSKNDVFHNSDPIIMGVNIVNGSLRLGTPLYLPYKNNIVLGRVSSIKKIDRTEAKIAHKDETVTIAIDQTGLAHAPVFGRQFDHTDQFFSHMSRRDIDTLKEYYADELTEVDLRMMEKFIELFKL